MEIARSLGWTKGTEIPEPSLTDSQDEDDLWDSPDDSASSAGGLGNAVSTLTLDDEEDDGSLHYIVLNDSDDTSKMTRLLAEHPDLDLNARDEFVRISTYSPRDLN